MIDEPPMQSIFDAPNHERLAERLVQLTSDSKRQWGRMSVGGMVCHLSDAFRMALGERQPKMRGNVFLKTVVRFIALSTPMTWPEGAKTVPEADQERGGTPPGDFSDDVATLEQLMARFASTGSGDMPAHPIFGKLTRGEWGRWGYKHVDHHFRQFGV